jgi:hypothetical protein
VYGVGIYGYAAWCSIISLGCVCMCVPGREAKKKRGCVVAGGGRLRAGRSAGGRCSVRGVVVAGRSVTCSAAPSLLA